MTEADFFNFWLKDGLFKAAWVFWMCERAPVLWAEMLNQELNAYKGISPT